MKGFFITGTDTGIGKTRSTLYLMKALQGAGFTVVGLKPVATGGTLRNGRWVNDDALALQQEASVALPYDMVNPYLFEPPVSPHIAADLAGRAIDLRRVVEICREAAEFADIVLVEGVGGWKVPLSDTETLADLAKVLGLPVILVVGLRLGCLNHALLSHDGIRSSGCQFAGWIANGIVSDFAHPERNLETLRLGFGCTPLGQLPFRAGPDVPGNGEFGDFALAAILRALAAYDKFAP